MSRLDGKRALVTGATGGLGAAVAEAFAAEGRGVALVARDPARLDSLRDRLGDATVAVAADVSAASEAARAVDEAVAAFGGLDAVVNAAAIDTVWRPVGELPIEEWDRAIAVNLSGTFYVCRAALPTSSRRVARSSTSPPSPACGRGRRTPPTTRPRPASSSSHARSPSSTGRAASAPTASHRA